MHFFRRLFPVWLMHPMDTGLVYSQSPRGISCFRISDCESILPGPLEPLGTAGVPLMIVLLFASLPFVDQKPGKEPFSNAGSGYIKRICFCGSDCFVSDLVGRYMLQEPRYELAQMEPPSMVSVASQNESEQVALNQKVTLSEAR